MQKYRSVHHSRSVQNRRWVPKNGSGDMNGSERLTFVALNVAELVRSVHFYRDLVGIGLREADHDADAHDAWYGGEHAAVSWTDGAFMHFALYPSVLPHRPVTTGAQIGFHVDDFDAIHARVVRAGTAVTQVP